MNTLESITHALRHHVTAMFSLSEHQAAVIEITINSDEHRTAFGDINTHAAMALASIVKKNPRDIAQAIAQSFTHEAVHTVTVAGPGFINLSLTPQAFTTIAQELFIQKADFFKNDPTTAKKNINIEFVSANPTGPLHVGHGRGGIIGDVLYNVFTFLGHHAVKEFYINDAGSQMHKLGVSLKIRCQQACGMDVAMIEDGYHGDYLLAVATDCLATYGAGMLKEPDTFFQEYAREQLLDRIKATLHAYGITFDVWFSEKTLHEDGSIQDALCSDIGILYIIDRIFVSFFKRKRKIKIKLRIGFTM